MRRGSDADKGQALVELALVLPMFLMVLFGIIILGLGVFYQQQVTNAAREAARWAAIHSATSSCPTVSSLDPDSVNPLTGGTGTYATYKPLSYTRADEPGDPTDGCGQYDVTRWARARIFGLPAANVQVAACWSGYTDPSTNNFDAPPPGIYTIAGVTIDFSADAWSQCRIDGQDPTTDPNAIRCQAGLTTTDQASNMSEGPGINIANRVSAFACYVWTPPLAGFLLIPDTIPLRAVITEPIQRQQ